MDHINNWVIKYTFSRSRICQIVCFNLSKEGTETYCPVEAAAAMSKITGLAYLPQDIKLIMGIEDDPVMLGCQKTFSAILAGLDFNDLEKSAEKMIDAGYSPGWVGIATTFATEATQHYNDAKALYDNYLLAVAAMAPLPDGLELDTVVHHVGLDTNPPAVDTFIEHCSNHFKLDNGIYLIPPPSLWIVGKHIPLIVTESDNGPIVSVVTPKGAIVINAVPSERAD